MEGTQRTWESILDVFSSSSTILSRINQRVPFANAFLEDLRSPHQEAVLAILKPMETHPADWIDIPNAKPLQLTHGAIECDHVSFYYVENKPIIRDLSLNINPGEKIGIVGRTGAEAPKRNRRRAGER